MGHILQKTAWHRVTVRGMVMVEGRAILRRRPCPRGRCRDHGGQLPRPTAWDPFALKDIYCIAGIRTTGHSRTRADDARIFALPPLPSRIKLARPWPPPRNPWNREHCTGGSSSGSGASVAAGMTMGGLGSDTGGSMRKAALQLTCGLVSLFGVYTNSFSYDHAGPMTWSVEDCAIILQAVAGHDTKDPASADRPVPGYRVALTGGLKGPRIGVLRHLFEEDGRYRRPQRWRSKPLSMCCAALVRHSRTHIFGRRRSIAMSRSRVPRASTKQCCGRGSTTSARTSSGERLARC